MKKFCSALVATGLVFPLVAYANEAGAVHSENNIKFYGFVRFDGTHDLGSNNTANGDWASFLQSQPIEGSIDSKKRGGTYLTARTSRFGFDGKLAGGTVGFKLEGDFNGTTAEGGQTGRAANNGTGLRIRHAYVEIQNWLVGQTWSNYEDFAGLPETVQFNPSLTAAAPRQAQVRYTVNLPTSQLSFAVENGGSYTSGASGADFDKGVDVTARWNKAGDWGHVSARMASVGYNTTDNSGVTHSARGYQAGLSGSTVVPTGKFVYGAFTGNGGGRYAWGSLFQGAVLTNSGISLFKSHGSHVGYTHNWSGTQRSNLAYSVVNFANNPNAIANESNKKISQMHLNLISNVAKNTELGVEYAYGKRTLMNPTGDNYGVEKRLNVALTTMF
jgi:hypothetical protein